MHLPSKSEQSNILIKLHGYADTDYAIHQWFRQSQYTESFDLIEDGTEDEEKTGMFYFRTINPTVDLCPAEAEMGATVETTKNSNRHSLDQLMSIMTLSQILATQENPKDQRV